MVKISADVKSTAKYKPHRRKGNIGKPKLKTDVSTLKEPARKRPQSKLLELKKKRESRLSITSPKQGSSVAKSNLSKFEMRYQRLKRLAKDLVFVSKVYVLLIFKKY